MLFGTAVLVSQADGAGESHLCGRIWRLAALHGVVMGVVFGGLCFGGEWFLGLVGQRSDIARGGGEVMAMFGWGMPPIFVAVATWLFLEGIGRPLPGTMVIIGANIVNVLLNWIFIYGNTGAPEMGATGAVLATTIVRWMMAASLVGYVFFMPGHGRYGVRGGMRGARQSARVFRRIGFPFAAAQGIEAGAFSTVTLFAGYPRHREPRRLSDRAKLDCIDIHVRDRHRYGYRRQGWERGWTWRRLRGQVGRMDRHLRRRFGNADGCSSVGQCSPRCS